MKPRRRLAGAVAIAVLAAAVAPAWAGAPTDQVRASVDRIIGILQDPALKSSAKTKERRAAIREAADTIFDFRETARRALGRHWQSVGEQDREEFVPLFTDLLERSYTSKIEQYSGEKISYVGESVDPGGEAAMVKTIFTTKAGAAVPINYSLLRRGDRWLVYDVFVEGVSLVANYRSQFDRIIQTASYQELVRRMKAGQADVPAPGGASPKGKGRT
ncbi:MAG: ABC transporter substrate-binding protein [Candidatus Rokubacteria bacterium]|nr:ABC transporter substrate-binding protein [Candidatus Rokubacteria bacterium]MBI3105777.1 ABC transporter substrate-binding protein [Candidatus Rokubacteria bacterium]